MTDDVDVLASFSEEPASSTPGSHTRTIHSNSTIRARSQLGLIDDRKIRRKQARISDLV